MYKEEKKSISLSRKIKLGYRLWKPGKHRRCIILIHGMASNLTRWSEFVEHTSLKKSWDIIRVDLRGHGTSLYRGRLSFAQWCMDLATIMDYEGYDKAVFAGHSLGAQVAMNIAALQPGRVSGLVLIDPVFYQGLPEKKKTLYRYRFFIRLLVSIILMLNKIGLHRRRISSRDLRELDEHTRKALLGTGKQDEMVAKYSSAWLDLKFFPAANLIQEFILTITPLPPPNQIKVPVLTILAAESTFGDTRITKRILSRFSSGTIANIDAFHWPLTEKPDQTREAIERWLDQTFPEGADV